MTGNTCTRLSVGEVERALTEACRRGHAEVIEFTVAPRDPCPEQVRGGHEWLIEFADPPRAPETFVRALDEALQRCNAEYRRMRAGDEAWESKIDRTKLRGHGEASRSGRYGSR